jgi:hypothetical protein
MRNPRPQDFDPSYEASKSPKPDKIDISGTVPIKPRLSDQKPIKSNRSEMRTENRTEEHPEIRPELRSVKLPIKRRTKRYSFEFYDDQIQQIRLIKIQTEMNGETIAMSEIVRQALDQYLNGD